MRKPSSKPMSASPASSPRSSFARRIAVITIVLAKQPLGPGWEVPKKLLHAPYSSDLIVRYAKEPPQSEASCERLAVRKAGQRISPLPSECVIFVKVDPLTRQSLVSGAVLPQRRARGQEARALNRLQELPSCWRKRRTFHRLGWQ